jgi:hypothetical protein
MTRYFAWLMLAGCASRPIDAPFDPSQPIAAQTGVYDVTIETIEDTCTPRYATDSQPRYQCGFDPICENGSWHYDRCGTPFPDLSGIDLPESKD